MKRVIEIFIISTVLFLTLVSLEQAPTAKKKGSKPHPHILATSNARIRTQFIRFVNLMKASGIQVDYSKISTIDLAPLRFNLLGVYSVDSKAIYINSSAGLPIMATRGLSGAALNKLQNDFVLVILAHEIMHSQGVGHVMDDANSLMATSAVNTIKRINEIGVEQHILDTYCKLKELQKTHAFPRPLMRPVQVESNYIPPRQFGA